MISTPKVSVAIPVYNFEQYVEHCINSTLEQKTDFNYEIVVGEDHSTDNTREILINLKNSYPDKINLILNDENLGLIHNFANIIDKCKGQYIAVLDGDDYWIDKLKLKKQVNFLDSHPSYSVCATASKKIFETSTKQSIIMRSPHGKKTFSVEDMLMKNFIVFGSAMFRKKYFDQPPEEYYQFTSQDFQLWVMLAEQGPIGYIDDVTTVYRIHESNRYGSYSDIKRWTISMKERERMASYVQPELKPYCYHCMYRYSKRLMYAYRDKNDLKKVKKHAAKALELIPYYQFDPFWQRLELHYYKYVYKPGVHRVLYPVLSSIKNSVQQLTKRSKAKIGTSSSG